MLRSTEQDTGILSVESNIIGYDASNARDLLFIYETNEYSRKIIRQIYSYFQIVGYKVNLFICQKRNLFGYKRLFDPGVRIILFPELYQTDSGLIRLISDVLCEKGRHSARTLLLFTFSGAVLPSYLEFEDVISIDSNDWVEKLHPFVHNTKKTIARRTSIATCRNIFDHNGVKIKRYCCEITGNDSLSSSKLHDNGIVYIIRGTTETETDISKQISSLLSVATGFGCEQTSTADSSLALLPTHIRSASIQHHTCVVIAFNSVFGSKSKASDYGILFREFENTAVLTLELCENKATSGSRPPFVDNKSGNVRLSGKYKDWYRVLLDAVRNVIDRTGRETVACTLLTTVDDSAIAVVPKLSKRASHRHAEMPTIVAPDTYSDNPNSYSRSSQSSHLSSTCWLQLGDGQESSIHYLNSEPSDDSGSHASLSSRFTYSDGDTSTDADTEFRSLYTALIEPSSFRQRSAPTAEDRRDGVI